VVYSKIIDDLLNSQGQSVSKQVTLPYAVPQDDSTEINTVYPNSLINMRDQVINTVGKVADILPLWMTSKQSDGNVLGFTPAWVIAYAKPGKGDQIAYYIKNQFGDRLNLVDFEVDRYELGRLLSKNWNSTSNNWTPTPAATTFDQNQTVFDHNSLKFIAPVDMYSQTQIYDRYLVFPNRNILGRAQAPVGNIVYWINNTGGVITWINDSLSPVEWINITEAVGWVNNINQQIAWIDNYSNLVQWVNLNFP
jgi:hypothetical protein